MRVAVVGHVEWTKLAQVDRVPEAGDVLHADRLWEGPGGGGAIAAVQLAKLAGECTFLTALGDDSAGRRSRRELERQGVRVLAAMREEPTREAVSMIDATRERTTMTLGGRLQPACDDPLPWDELGSFDAVYFVAGDVALLRRARAAAVLVVTCREIATAAAAAVALDAMVGSGRDPAERYDADAMAEPPAYLVVTDGANGGTVAVRGDAPRPYRAVSLPGPLVDTYGVGDNFAGALTYGLAATGGIDGALAIATRCAAACAAGRGPFGGHRFLSAA